jgi:hypothetical protein
MSLMVSLRPEGKTRAGILAGFDVEVAHAFRGELYELVVSERHRGDGVVVLWCGVVRWWRRKEAVVVEKKS